MSSSAITTSLLFPGQDTIQIGAEVLGVEATATTYVLRCIPSDDEDECATYSQTMTIGPWASKTLPSGAAPTGNFDVYASIGGEGESYEVSIHCDMSRSVAQACRTSQNVGGTDTESIEPTGTLAPSEIEELGFATFRYMPVTITAGQDLLSISPTGSQISASRATASGAQSSGPSETAASGSSETATTGTGNAASGAAGSAASSAASPKETNGASSSVIRIFTAMSVAALAVSLIVM